MAYSSLVGEKRAGCDEVGADWADDLKPPADAARAVAAIREHQVVAVTLQESAAAVLRSRGRVSTPKALNPQQPHVVRFRKFHPDTNSFPDYLKLQVQGT